METRAIILAAGKGTRMKSKTPKVLHTLAGRPMLDYALKLASETTDTKPIVVIGHGSEEIRAYIGEQALLAEQEPQLGTAHAVLQAQNQAGEEEGLILIMYADMPLLTAQTIKSLIDTQKANKGVMSMLTVESDNPRGFGRIVRDGTGNLVAIVEEASATPEQLNIHELNVGVYCFQAAWMWQALKRIKVSPKGEYYLTDLVEIAISEGQHVETIMLDDFNETIGINTHIHLAEAESVLYQRINQKWMLQGVRIVRPEDTYIEDGVVIGQDTIIYPGCYLRGVTEIGTGCEVGPNTVIENSTIGNDCKIQFAILEGAQLDDNVSVGPFAHLRKGAKLQNGVHMGNFGEIKNSTLGPNSKMGHFSYIGDAQIGGNVNIGAGTITCNYDGMQKNKTVIEDDVFIGSDTMLVAPIKIGKGAKTGAGAVVNKDVPAGKVVVGVPAREIIKKNKDEKNEDQ